MNARTPDSAMLDHADALIERAKRAQYVSVPRCMWGEAIAALNRADAALRRDEGCMILEANECHRMAVRLTDVEKEPEPQPTRARVKPWSFDPLDGERWQYDSMAERERAVYFPGGRP